MTWILNIYFSGINILEKLYLYHILIVHYNDVNVYLEKSQNYKCNITSMLIVFMNFENAKNIISNKCYK